jgi:hypothetical protein
MKNSKFKMKRKFRMSKITLFLLFLSLFGKISAQNISYKKYEYVGTGASQYYQYLPMLAGKRVGVVTNHTGIIQKIIHNEDNTTTIENEHLVDFLLTKKVNVTKVFAPEHGFRGTADAGEVIKDGIDAKTKLPIVSLYGKNKKPTSEQLKGIEVMLFDLQDVGVRFYTYISTLHYVMEACAENYIPLVILDRPNPNGYYIDGAVLEPPYKSFIGMHLVPVVYGMTIAEYAQMINGEKWLKNGIQCNLKIVPLKNYDRNVIYSLPIPPSPNLPNETAVNLYPSLCFFEGTNISMGRGTQWQFQIYGSPYLKKTAFTFTPKPNSGDKNPKYNGKICYGEDLSRTPPLTSLNLSWLLKAYQQTEGVKTNFFNASFDKLAGNKELKEQLVQHKTEKEIKTSWKDALEIFKKTRKKYLLYPSDF